MPHRAALDPLELALAAPLSRSEPPNPVSAVRSPGLEPLVAELVRQIAWGGDRKRGAARIELGSGRYAGASVVIHAEGGELTLEVVAPPGVDAGLLAERLRARLESRGLAVRELSVR